MGYGMVWYGMVWYGMVWYGMNRMECGRRIERLELVGTRYARRVGATEYRGRPSADGSRRKISYTVLGKKLNAQKMLHFEKYESVS